MKTAISLLLILIAGLFQTSNAQLNNFGNEWQFGSFQMIHPGVEGYRFYGAAGTITFAGDTFTQISGNGKTSLLRQEGTSVFYLHDSVKYLLFDAGHVIGDTINIDAHFNHPFGSKDTVVNIRIKIADIFYNRNNSLDPNDSLKVFKFIDIDDVGLAYDYDTIGYFTEKVIRHFGGIGFNFDQLLETNIQDGEGYYLRCFASDSYEYKINTLGTKSCDYSNVGIPEFKGSLTPFNIYPNPASDRFFIEPGNEIISCLKLFDLQGQLVKSFPFPDPMSGFEIDRSKMPAGLYYCVIETKKGSYSRKVILQ